MHREIVMPQKGSMRGTPTNPVSNASCESTPVNKHSGGGKSSAYSKTDSSSKPKPGSTASSKQSVRGGDQGAKSNAELLKEFHENVDKFFGGCGKASPVVVPPEVKRVVQQAARPQPPPVARVTQVVASRQTQQSAAKTSASVAQQSAAKTSAPVAQQQQQRGSLT